MPKERPVHHVKASRLQDGRWNHEKNRDESEGDIRGSYSSDIIAMSSRVRSAFRFDGFEWISTGNSKDGDQAYKLIPVEKFTDAKTTYRWKAICV